MAGQSRTGVVVLRVWIEGSRPEDLMVRITATADVERGGQETAVVRSPSVAADWIRDWLGLFVAQNAGGGESP